MKVLLVTYHAVAIALLALVMALVELLGMPLYALMSDPAAVNGTSAAVGFLSNLGVVIFAGSAAVALFAAFVHHRTRSHPEHAGLFAAVGILTLVIMLDDLYMVHDRILSGRFGIGTDATAPVYALAAALIGWRWRALLHGSGLPLAVSALLWLSISVGIDSHIIPAPSTSLIYEDGAKFVGMVGWSAWIGYAAADSLTGVRPIAHENG